MSTSFKPPLQNKPKQMSNGFTGGIVSKDQLSSFKLKPTGNSFKSRENNNNNNNTGEEEKPDFLKLLKPPAERQKEKLQNKNNFNDTPPSTPPVINNKPSVKPPVSTSKPPSAISKPQLGNKPPQVGNKPPVVSRKPPTDEELTVSRKEKKSEDQLALEKEKKVISQGSVRNSKFLFEQFEQNRTKKDNIVRGRSSSKQGSFISQNGSFAAVNTSNNIPEVNARPVDQQLVEQLETYDDVAELTLNNRQQQQETYDDVAEITSGNRQQQHFEQQETYDDVAETTSNNRQQQQYVEQQEIYDDVAEITSNNRQQQHVQQQHVAEEIYDDVDSDQFPPPPSMLIATDELIEEDTYDDIGQPAPPTLRQAPPNVPAAAAPAEPIEEDFYDDVVQQTASPNNLPTPSPITGVSLSALPPPPSTTVPLKHEKTFGLLPEDRLIAPYGLEKWLKDIINANKHRLKTNPLEGVNLNIKTSSPLPQNNAGVDLIEEELYDDIQQPDSIKPEPPSLSKIPSKSGETEKERAKREKKEKSEQDKREKARREEEKKEKKKKDKELKSFGLSSDVPFTISGTYICQKDFAATKKLHLSFQFGDEIQVIEVKKNFNQPGKMVVQNSRDGKVGYVLKSDFGITDETPPVETPPEPTPTVVSPIPTEDDQEMYELILGQQAEAPAPPVPETPRPRLAPPTEVQDEEIYEVIQSK